MSTIVPEPDNRVTGRQPNPSTLEPTGGVAEREEPVNIQVSALAYVRTMWALLWTAFRHPFTTSNTDVTTGEVVEPTEEDEI